MLASIDLLNNSYVYVVPAGERFAVVETKEAGKGSCYFVSDHQVLFIKAKDQAPIVWSLRNQKCAEAAFLVVRPDGDTELHIIEMKSKLSLSDFVKVIEQWRGMYLSALAVVGVTNGRPPTKVTVYVAYKADKVIDVNTSQPIMLKTRVGGQPQKGVSEWANGRVSLHHGVIANIVKGERSPDDYDFGRV